MTGHVSSDAVEVVQRPSPNFNDRPGPISMLVLHYTGMETEAQALDRLCDPESRVSAHYTICESGEVYQHVSEDKRAWHAGVAHWRDIEDVNGVSLGIELVNPGHEFGYRAFSEAQMESVLALGRDLVRRYGILACNVVGHSDVAPTRKQDPGELFDWARLSRGGLGVWPRPSFRAVADDLVITPDSAPGEIMELQRALQSIGYGLAIDGVYGSQTTAVIQAFQRHFWQGEVTGEATSVTLHLIGHIAGLVTVELFSGGS